jgi:hypothetical protein
MKDKKHYVVQLRSESVHEENDQQARDILGDVVPCIPGFTWRTTDRPSNWPAVNNVKVAGQLGDMIGRCCTPESNSERHVIDTLIMPRLHCQCI